MYAVLSDVHGNLAALKAVLDEVDRAGIRQVVCLGDIAGYYYEFGKCLELLRQYDLEFVIGNHDLMLIEALSDDDALEKTTKKYGFGCQYACNEITDDQINFLNMSPNILAKTFAGNKRGLFCHANPWGDDLHVYADSSLEIYDRFLDFPEDAFFIGHSHYQFKVKHGVKWIYSIGSVGQNRKKGGSACWATVDEKMRVELKETQYCPESTIKTVLDDDPKKRYLIEVLLR